MRNILFSPPDISEQEIEEVVSALHSGWITTGPRTKQFEKEIAAYCNADASVCFNSATATVEMLLRFLGIGAGDEVITSSYTYTASASPAVHVGATVKLIDVAPDCFEMDYDALEKAITPATKVIIPVDLGGVICDYDKIYEIINRKKSLFVPSNDIQRAFGRIIVVADAAHAFGAVKNGEKAGKFADFTSFSFHAVKNLTTAEGGACTWRNIPGVDNDEIYHTLQLLSLHGQSKDALAKTKPGAWEYDIVIPGYKYNMTDIMAAIGLRQLSRYDGMLERRHEIIGRYDEAFHKYGVKTLDHYSGNQRSSGHLYLARVPGINNVQRNDIIMNMGENGIACNVHYKPLPMMTAYKNLGFDIADYPNAFKQFENEITLPLHTLLSDDDVDYVISVFSDCLKSL